MITLFHGSNVEIHHVDLSKSKPGKDFGRGFYLNPNFEQAREMAAKTCRIIGEGSEIVNEFVFDEEGAKAAGLKILIFPDYSVEWAEFIVENRKNQTEAPIHDFDIVIGPIADDSVGVQVRRFILGYLPVERLVEELKFHGNHAVQYFFANEKALNYLRKR